MFRFFFVLNTIFVFCTLSISLSFAETLTNSAENPSKNSSVQDVSQTSSEKEEKNKTSSVFNSIENTENHINDVNTTLMKLEEEKKALEELIQNLSANITGYGEKLNVANQNEIQQLLQEKKKLEAQLQASQQALQKDQVEIEKYKVVLENYVQLKKQLLDVEANTKALKILISGILIFLLSIAIIIFDRIIRRTIADRQKRDIIHILHIIRASSIGFVVVALLFIFFTIFQSIFTAAVVFLGAIIIAFKDQLLNIFFFYSNTIWKYKVGDTLWLSDTQSFGKIIEISLFAVTVAMYTNKGIRTNQIRSIDNLALRSGTAILQSMMQLPCTASCALSSESIMKLPAEEFDKKIQKLLTSYDVRDFSYKLDFDKERNRYLLSLEYFLPKRKQQQEYAILSDLLKTFG